MRYLIFLLLPLSTFCQEVRGPGRSHDTIKGPIVVVNNRLYKGSINDINPKDVKKITVYHNMDAMSMYGTPAKEGAIVITTRKKGKYRRMK
jgi:hypothetical protein